MGLHLARPDSVGNEPSVSITWLEYTETLSVAVDSTQTSLPGETFEILGCLPCAGVPDELGNVSLAESAVRVLERALEHVRGRTGQSFGLVNALELQCEAARLRLVLMQLYTRLGQPDRARALARETVAVL